MDDPSRTILIVEDNPQDTELMMYALRENRFDGHVRLVRDGVEAIAFATSNPNLCLMLLDLKMPKVDGIDVLQSMRANERTCCIPIVILTSSSQESDIRDAYRSGANGYVVKPFDIEKLSEVVGAVGAYWLNVNRVPRR
jgi:two-component system response regulator